MKYLFIILVIIIHSINLYSQNISNQTDRELLIELRTKIYEIDKRFEFMQNQFDKRFEQFDKRFEQVDSRFSDMFSYLNILLIIFSTVTAGIVSFALWDRRTIIGKSKSETIKVIEKEGKLSSLIKALRELAIKNKDLEIILKNYNLI